MHIVGTKRVELTGLLSLLVALLIYLQCGAHLDQRGEHWVGFLHWNERIRSTGATLCTAQSSRRTLCIQCAVRTQAAWRRGGACRGVGMSMCVHSSVWVCFRTAPRRPDGGDDQDGGGWVAFADRLDETCGHSQPLAVSCVATPEPVWARSQSSIDASNCHIYLVPVHASIVNP